MRYLRRAKCEKTASHVLEQLEHHGMLLGDSSFSHCIRQIVWLSNAQLPRLPSSSPASSSSSTSQSTTHSGQLHDAQRLSVGHNAIAKHPRTCHMVAAASERLSVSHSLGQHVHVLVHVLNTVTRLAATGLCLGWTRQDTAPLVRFGAGPGGVVPFFSKKKEPSHVLI